MANTFVIPSIFTAIDKFTAPVEKMDRSMGAFGEQAESAQSRVDRRFRKIGDAAQNVAKKSFIIGAAVAAPLVLMANSAVKFEDKLADVGKTTGLEGVALKKFGDEILDMSTKTRTSIDDLAKIAEIGGQLGIAKGDLSSFVKSADQFNVALGKDFSGGVEQAVSQVGKIKTLFADTRNLSISDAIQKAGSAINELGAIGSGTSENIADFTLRLGALPDALKPSLANTMALGTFLEEAGIDAQIGAGGLTNFFLVAAKSLPGFAAQMKMSSVEAKALLASNPTEFAKKFADSLKGLKPDQLAATLKKLHIESQESIKVIGALGAGTAHLTELQEIANKSFAAGTSLTAEYNKKNETTAAQLEKAKNNFEALSITIGTQLLPILNKIIQKVLPVIKGIIDWTKRNPALTQTLLVIAGAIAAVAFVISGLASIVAIASKAVMVFNAILAMNPIGLIVIAIIALIVLIAAIIDKWNEWGAALTIFMGPLGLIISLIQSFRRNWEMISNAFKTDGIIGGLKAIGVTIIDAILMPLQQLLGIVAKFTGFDWAANAAKGIEKFRADMGVNVTTDESGKPLAEKPALNPKGAAQDALVQRLESTNNANVAIDINDPTGRAKASSDNDFVKIKTTSTMPSYGN